MRIVIGVVVLTILGCCTSFKVYAQRVLLPVPHRQQVQNMCVPTSVAMVLAYYGEEADPLTLKALAGNTKGLSGTYYCDMLRGLDRVGYRWDAQGFGLDHSGFLRGLDAIRHALNDQRPVLMSTARGSIGHTMVVAGYDDSLQRLTFVDPTSDPPGLRVVSYEDAEWMWHDSFQSVARFLMTTWPKPIDKRPALKCIDPGKRVEIVLPFRAQARYTVPACVSMILRYYGDSLSEDQVKFSVTGTLNDGPVYYADVCNAMLGNGYHWTTEHCQRSDSTALELQFQKILRSLDLGNPVIVTTGLFPTDLPVVVTGYDIQSQLLFLLDVTMPAPGERLVTFDQFKDLWHEIDARYAGVLITQPKSSKQ